MVEAETTVVKHMAKRQSKVHRPSAGDLLATRINVLDDMLARCARARPPRAPCHR